MKENPELQQEDKVAQRFAQDTPLARIGEQIKMLDRALNTIDGWSDESEQARGFIVGQIEALRWALKQFDV